MSPRSSFQLTQAKGSKQDSTNDWLQKGVPEKMEELFELMWTTEEKEDSTHGGITKERAREIFMDPLAPLKKGDK